MCHISILGVFEVPYTIEGFRIKRLDSTEAKFPELALKVDGKKG